MNCERAILAVVIAQALATATGVAKDRDYSDVYGRFAADFKWATATAAYQVEGGWNASGKAPSIWDTESHTRPSPIADGSTGDVACDSYNKFADDIDIMSELGTNAYRLSLSWTRLITTNGARPGDYVPNPDGLRYYTDVLQALSNRSIEPMVTLFHWDLPQELQDKGGWMNPIIPDYFYHYADYCYRSFGHLVKIWLTINEPSSIVGGYFGDFSPAVPRCHACPYFANKNMLMAHANAYRLYDERYRAAQQGRVGIVLVLDDYRPYDSSVHSEHAARRTMLWNSGVYLNPLLVGDWPETMKDVTAVRYRDMGRANPLPVLTIAEQQHIYNTVDFLGINIYTAHLVKAATTPLVPNYVYDTMAAKSQDASWPRSASPWLRMTPTAVVNTLLWLRSFLTRRPATEIIITECGWSNHPDDSLDDRQRIEYYRQYIGALLYTHQNFDINITGFTAWSLMDNFEWRAGYTQRFGLYHVNFSDPARPRVAKSSAKWYAQTIADNGFPAPNGTTTEEPVVTTTEPVERNCSCPYDEHEPIIEFRGVISSPGYPHYYCPGVKCTYMLQLPVVGLVYQLRIIGNLAPDRPGSYISDQVGVGGTICPIGPVMSDSIGARTFDRVFYSAHNNIGVYLQTYNESLPGGEGFVAYFQAIVDPYASNPVSLNIGNAEIEFQSPDEFPPNYELHKALEQYTGTIPHSDGYSENCDCGQRYHGGRYGFFSLPSYFQPNTNYCNNMMCWYQITVEPGYSVHVYIDGNTREEDIIMVFDNVCRYQMDAMYAGSEFRAIMVSTGNTLGFTFSSDSKGTDRGFYARYYAIPDVPPPPGPLPHVISPLTLNCTCPQTTYAANIGIVASPRSPDPYCDELSCDYVVTTWAGSVARLLLWGELYDGFDWLYLYGTKEGNVSRTGYFQEYIYGTSNVISMRFTTDASGIRDGWRAFYQPCYVQPDGSYKCQLDSVDEEMKYIADWLSNRDNNEL